MNGIESTMGFAIFNNVFIEVRNEQTGKIVKTVKTHNKATRKMVQGILAYVSGWFTVTDPIKYEGSDKNWQDEYNQKRPMYEPEVANQFIPCYFNVGDGGVEIDPQTGLPNYGDNVLVPPLVEGWNETVSYSSDRLVREYPLVDAEGRKKIRKQSSTLIDSYGVNYDTDNPPDMDSIFFDCEMSPNQINPKYQGNGAYVTELGLFASNICGTPDLLAYVKLGNYEEDGVTKTNALYVKPEDTIVIKWVISIAAIGKDNIVGIPIKDEDTYITNEVQKIPTEMNIEVIDIPDNT